MLSKLVLALAALGPLAQALAVSNDKRSSQNESSPLSQCMCDMDGVLPSPQPEGFEFSGNIRRYYVTAEQVEWDYAPTGWDNWLGVPMNESFRAQTVGYIPSNTSIGTKYDKALYRGYTDATFTNQTEQPAWEGYQGPIMRAEVGDMIEILFVNKLEKFYATMHSMGLFYPKYWEGSLYPNGTAPSPGDAVPPGGCFVYKWLVPPAATPNPGLDSKLYSYHSYVSMYPEQDAGLGGPVIIYSKGKMEEVMSKNREYVLFFGDNQESNSFLALDNVKKYLPSAYDTVANLSYEYPQPSMNYSFWYPQMINTPKTNVSSDMASNFFPMNGYIFANNPPFESCLNDNLIYYIYNGGFDAHVAHWHGNNVVLNGLVTATVSNAPGQMITVTGTAANPGLWHVICHFNTHQSKGMESKYIIYPSDNCPLTPLKK